VELGGETNNTQTSGIANCAGEFGVPNPLHAALDDGDWERRQRLPASQDR
jgi:hypothetical protein